MEDKVTTNVIATRLPPPPEYMQSVTFEKYKNTRYNSEMKERKYNVQALYCNGQAVPYLCRKCTLFPEQVVRGKILDLGTSKVGGLLRVAGVVLTGAESRYAGFNRPRVTEICLP